MQHDLHPEYSEVTIQLADGSEITTRSTMETDSYETEVDSTNHPFYTGRRQFVDTAGRVEKFNRRYGLTDDDEGDDEETEDAADEDRVRISLVGKPNAGKSSLVNATLGFDRAIVTEKPGTTRDTVQSLVQYEDRELMLVDTAGMRKRSKTEGVEFYATVRSERAIKAGDVCVLVLDATEELHKQDLNVLNEVNTHKKGMVIAVNKWDLVPKDGGTMKQYTKYLKQYLGRLDHAPIVYVSAVTKQRVYELLDKALAVAEEREKRVQTSALNDAVQAAMPDPALIHTWPCPRRR